jgi:hypothetical protein
MSGKGSFTSRERIAMIVVAGVVAIAIAALALQRRNAVPVVVEQQSSQTATRKTVKDSVDTIGKAAKHAKKHHKKRAPKAAKPAKPKPTPKPRDYFTSPENE